MHSWPGKKAATSAIRSVPLGVIRAGHPDIRAEGLGGGLDSFIVRGDDDGIELGTFLATLPDVLDERFSGDFLQGFAGEAGGGPTGRDHGETRGHGFFGVDRVFGL